MGNDFLEAMQSNAKTKEEYLSEIDKKNKQIEENQKKIKIFNNKFLKNFYFQQFFPTLSLFY